MLHFGTTVRHLRVFLIGALAGAIVGLTLLAGLYASPWRNPLYLKADPKVLAVREKLDAYQEHLAANEGRIALGIGDSLAVKQAAQNKTWQEYKVWRQRYGEMAHIHVRTSRQGFLAWSQSLLMYALPLELFFTLGAGLLALLFWMKVPTTPRTMPMRNPKARELAANAPALDQFQEAVRRIADIQAQSPVRQKRAVASSKFEARPEPRPMPADLLNPALLDSLAAELSGPQVLPMSSPRQNQGPVTSPMTSSLSSGANRPLPAKPSVPQSILQPPLPPELAQPLSKPGLNPEDTTYLDVLSGWDDVAPETALESVAHQAYLPPMPPTARQEPTPSALTMQDEEEGIPDLMAQDLGGEDPYAASATGYGQMPATTEFEKVERQKDEVVKLARRGLTSSEISRRLKISQDQVELIIRLRRQRG